MIEKPFFEKLPPLKPPQPEEKEIFKPKWNCFCCHDSGFIIRAELVIEIGLNDLSPTCNRPGCNAASHFSNLDLDRRVSPEICEQIHQWELDCWKETVRSQWEKIVAQINSLASSKSISASNRSENDEREIGIQKENAQAKLDELDKTDKELDEIDF